MNIKYSVRPLDKNNMVTESIFETKSLIEALKKVEEQSFEASTKYIIVSHNKEIDDGNITIQAKTI